MAIKENALPVSQSIGSGDYLRKVSSGGVSQQVPFEEVAGAVVTVDPAIDSESENPVQNKAIAAALDAAGTQTQQAIATAIQTEVTNRNAAIESAIDDEETARNTAISEAVAAEAQAREAADEELDQSKADTDGNYPDMTVGNADQLLSSIYTEDQIPYNFRQSGGGLSIGDREIDKIVGGTIAWNQLLTNVGTTATKNGVTFTHNDDGTYTINGTATAETYHDATATFQCPPNHVILLAGCPSGGSSTTFSASDGYRAYGNSADFGSGKVFKKTTDNSTFRMWIGNGYTANNLVFKPQYFDLTQMFGSAIADYIYSLEQATAGAGVAYFRKLFPKPYYAYNAGELMSVQAASHDMVGFNQWDEEVELGRINASTGELITATDRIRSKNKIPAIPGTTYYLYCASLVGTPASNIYAYFYGPDDSFLGSEYASNYTFTTPAGCAYMRIMLGGAYGTTYRNDVCINLSHNGSRNGEYEPYEKHSYELDANLILRGIPKLDSSNNLYYDGDEYESDGSVNRRYGIVDLGTLDWEYYATWGSNTNMMVANNLQNIAKFPTSDNGVANMITHGYITTSRNSAYGSSDDKVIDLTQAGRLQIVNHAYSDLETFKSALSGHYLVYELATPATESAAPYTNPQTVSDWGTEEYVDAAVQEGDRDVAVPVGHVTDYLANLRDKLQNLPDAANADGTYLVQQTSGQMALLAYTPGVNVPAAPTTDGTYTLQAVVSGGVATYSWVSS